MNKQPTISAQKRTNNVIGVLADILKPLSDRADKYALSNSIPLVGGMTVAELTGLKGAQGLLDDVSYGAPVVRGGSFQTAQIDPRVLDVAGLVPTVGGVLKGGGAYGKALAKEAGRNINEGTTIGQMLDPRMNMIAYHGSPHNFDKFSMDKIGTGEGAQAYGHGLYFADNPNVAKEYQKELGVSNVPFFSKNNEIIKILEPVRKKGTSYIDMNPITEADKVINHFEFGVKNIDELINKIKKEKNSDYYKEFNFDFESAINKLNLLKNEGYKLDRGDTGSFYKVDISDDAIPNMLLWDKPLSEQPESVRKALNKLKNNAPSGGMYQESLQPFENTTGNGLFRAFVNDLSMDGNAQPYKTFSMLMNEYGVPGIRYLDAGSRGQGSGTMNTVVFDDNLVKILEKNGKPVGAK